MLYSQENFSAQLDLLQQTFQIAQDEIDLPAFPLYVIIDVLLGVTSVIPDIKFPVPSKTDPKKILDTIQKFNIPPWSFAANCAAAAGLCTTTRFADAAAPYDDGSGMLCGR